MFDWESFADSVRYHCLHSKNFDHKIEKLVLSNASIFFSFVKDGKDDVNTPCWVQLDVLEAFHQAQGTVSRSDCILSYSRKVEAVFIGGLFKLLSEPAFVVRFKVARGTGSVWCLSALWDCYSGLIFTQFLSKQRRATIGPFIRGKVRRVLHRTRLK